LGSGSLLGRSRGGFPSGSSRFSWRVGARARLVLLAAVVIAVALGAVLLTGRDTRSAAAAAPVPARGVPATAVGIPSVALLGRLPALEVRRRPTPHHANTTTPSPPAAVAASSASSASGTPAAVTPTTPVTPTVTPPVAPIVPTRTAAPRVSAPTPRPPSSGSGGGATVGGGG
jgi:hypothetical protein